MKKATKMIIILLFMAAPFLYATAGSDGFKSVLQKSFMVQGGYYDFFTLKIIPLSAQSQSYVHGMPFDLAGEDIRPGTQAPGRLIASWEILSNTPNFLLEVEATPLLHEEAEKYPTDPVYSTPLTYMLNFTYTLSYYDNGYNRSISKNFVISSGVPQTAGDMEANNPLYGSKIDLDSYVGSTDGKIYFKLSQDSYKKLHDPNSTLAKGYYSGHVTVTMKVGK